MDRKSVHNTLHDLPWLFQVWAAKHVLGIAGTMEFLAHQDDRSPLCPSCNKCKETCKHIARCPEAGRTLIFEQSAQGMKQNLEKNNTHPDLRILVLQYLCGRGSILCSKCLMAMNLPCIIQEFTESQDIIGWDNFIMGMLSSKLLPIQGTHLLQSKSISNASRWISGLIMQLLQVTHTQWI